MSKGRPYGPGTLQVWDDPTDRGASMGGVLLRLLVLVALCALVAAVASRVMH